MIFRSNWGEDRVYFPDAEGRLISLPAQWTNVVTPSCLPAWQPIQIVGRRLPGQLIC